MIVIAKQFKSVISIILLFLLAIIGILMFKSKNYMIFAIIGALICIIPLFIHFERSRNTTREIVVIAAMIAICIAGRFVFIAIPHFKPVTALVIITGMYFGGDAGFLTGALTALLSNMQYGQGPWTIFQMAVWGIIGFTAGLLNKNGHMYSKIILVLFSALAGCTYSVVMDIYTTISLDDTFSLTRYLYYVVASLPIMIEYMISNVIFILLFQKPIGRKLQRLKTKYGIFN